MAITLNNTVRSAMAQQILDALDADENPATLQFYTGTRPAALGSITSQTLLGTLTCSQPAGSVDAGVLTFDPIAEDPEADDDGTAAWARLSDGAGVPVCDLSAGGPGSGADIELNDPDIVAGGPIQVASATITVG